jgi:hypothetical protein
LFVLCSQIDNENTQPRINAGDIIVIIIIIIIIIKRRNNLRNVNTESFITSIDVFSQQPQAADHVPKSREHCNA